MPFTTCGDGARLYWKLDGEADRPALVLLNSIGTDISLWDGCVPHLLPAFRLLRIDTRGHGASDAPDGDYDMPLLASDVVAVMNDAGVAKATVAGVSLGGMVALQLALDHPSRIDRLIPICTSATMDIAAWTDRIATVRTQGTAAIADVVMGRFLSPEFTTAHPDTAAGIRRGLLLMQANGYAGAGAAIRDMALADRLPTLALPVLVVAGDRDTSTPFDPHGRFLVDAIPKAQVVHLDAAHLAPIEAPADLAAHIRTFALPQPDRDSAAETLFDAGLRNRRRVLGDAWVDRSLADRTPFTADFQAMITRLAWGEIWGRPGLEDRTRRLLVIAITASLGRWEEFGLHVRAGLTRNGFTRDELKEVLMQTAIYAGVPAANTGFAEASRIIADIEASSAKES